MRNRELIKTAGQLGFVFDRYDGRRHVRLRHAETGLRYSVANTPSDRRSHRNALAALQRLSGRRLPRGGRKRTQR